MPTLIRLLCLVVVTLLPLSARCADEGGFRVGFAQRDITPQVPTPMWGYGLRHDRLSEGFLDPLMAKAIVVEAGTERLAMVGLDLGRAPTPVMMEEIRTTIRDKAKVEHLLIVGSHTHHGPVLELSDREGFGKGKFDPAIAYLKSLPGTISAAIVDAASKLQPAKMAVTSAEVPRNRNRQSKKVPAARDPVLAVMRFDDAQGKPLAILVNFAGHPVMTDTKQLKFSADFPGFMMNHVEREMGAPCVFIQGATGDLSVDAKGAGVQGFGELLGQDVISLVKPLQTAVPEKPSIQSKVDHFLFSTRIDLNNPAVMSMYSIAFFPELIRNMAEDHVGGLKPELNTVLINGDVAIVGGSGEFFSNHAVRLRNRSYVKQTFFFGYCNAYHNYFPTIEAISEGGYGADTTVSPVQIGAGEEMMNRALMNIYSMLGKMPAPAPLK